MQASRIKLYIQIKRLLIEGYLYDVVDVALTVF